MFDSLFNLKTYRDVNKGDIIYLDIDGVESKSYLFGLFPKTVSKEAPYRIISKKTNSKSFIKIVAKNVFDDSVQTISVLSYWRARTNKK